MAESIVQIRWAYSNKRQSAYQTETPSGDMTQSHPFVNADMGAHDSVNSDNAAQYGKGHEFATRDEILSWNSAFTRTFQATTKILGWAFAFHCGQVTTTTLGGGAFRHDFEYMDPVLGTGYYGSPRQQPVTTVWELVASNLVRVFPSMLVKTIEVTGSQNDWVMLTLEMQGSGGMRRAHPSGFTFPNSTLATTGGEGTLLRNASLSFQHGVSGALEDFSCSVRSFRFRSEFALFEEDGYCPGSGYLVSGSPTSGQIRNKLEFSRRAVVFEFVVKAPSTNNVIFDRHEQSTTLSANLTITGSQIATSGFYHLLTINVPQLRYRSVPIGADGDQIIYSVGTMVLYDDAEANPWTARVQNQFSSYLVSS
jgi:hypothetical protein